MAGSLARGARASRSDRSNIRAPSSLGGAPRRAARGPQAHLRDLRACDLVARSRLGDVARGGKAPGHRAPSSCSRASSLRTATGRGCCGRSSAIRSSRTSTTSSSRRGGNRSRTSIATSGRATAGNGSSSRSYFARQSLLVREVGFRDYRLAALLVLSIAAAIKFARAASAPSIRRGASSSSSRSSRTSPGSSSSAIYRYLVPLEVLSGPLIVGCVLYRSARDGAAYGCIALLAILLVGTTRPGDWGRLPFGHAYFDVEAPQLAPRCARDRGLHRIPMPTRSRSSAPTRASFRR